MFSLGCQSYVTSPTFIEILSTTDILDQLDTVKTLQSAAAMKTSLSCQFTFERVH